MHLSTDRYGPNSPLQNRFMGTPEWEASPTMPLSVRLLRLSREDKVDADAPMWNQATFPRRFVTLKSEKKSENCLNQGLIERV